MEKPEKASFFVQLKKVKESDKIWLKKIYYGKSHQGGKMKTPKIVMMKTDDLIPYENNPRKNDDSVMYVANSIMEFGFKVPIVIDKDNVIVAGHTRLKAAKSLGIKEIPVIIADDLTDDQVKAFRLADNKTAEIATWDFEALDIELDALYDLDFDMTEFGFDLDDTPNIEEPKEMLDADIPEEIETICKLGDIWQMGDHRLICGDSTKSEIAVMLMQDEKAKMLFTSPPYSDMREYRGGKDLSVSNIAKFITAYRPYTDYQCVNLGIQRKENEIYQYWDEYIAEAKQAGYKLMAWNVWDKGMTGNIGQASAFFPLRHEFVFVFGTEFFEINLTVEKKPESITTNPGPKTKRNVDGTTSYHTTGDTSQKYKQMESVLFMHPVLDNNIRDLHPATFPVGLPAEYIKAMTKAGDIVIEPFGGSGTTLIACEQLDRRCFICELDEHYCDVIIQRWENFTGQKAVKVYGES